MIQKKYGKPFLRCVYTPPTYSLQSNLLVSTPESRRRKEPRETKKNHVIQQTETHGSSLLFRTHVVFTPEVILVSLEHLSKHSSWVYKYEVFTALLVIKILLIYSTPFVILTSTPFLFSATILTVLPLSSIEKLAPYCLRSFLPRPSRSLQVN